MSSADTDLSPDVPGSAEISKARMTGSGRIIRFKRASPVDKNGKPKHAESAAKQVGEAKPPTLSIDNPEEARELLLERGPNWKVELVRCQDSILGCWVHVL
eukprot:6415642-Prymnesium_polylepis.1